MTSFSPKIRLKSEMPTKIDTAAASAQDDITEAIRQLRSVPTRVQGNQPLHQHPLHQLSQDKLKVGMHLSSPLFRDEAREQELRYLDRFLGSPSAALSDLSRNGENRDGSRAISRRISSSQTPLVRRSKVSTILSSYDSLRDAEHKCKGGRNGDMQELDNTSETNVEGKTVCSRKSSLFDTQISMNKYTDGLSGLSALEEKNQNVSDGPARVTNYCKQARPDNSQHALNSPHNSPMTYDSAIRATVTRRHSMKTSNIFAKKDILTERKTKPSIHKRRTFSSHHKILKNARTSSRKFIKRAVQWGKRCAQRAVGVSDFVKRNVRRALLNIHSMLEDQVNYHERRNRTRNGNVAPGSNVGVSGGLIEGSAAAPETRQQHMQKNDGNKDLVARNNIALASTHAPSQKFPPPSAFKLSPLWAAPVVRDIRIRNSVTSAVRQSIVRDTELI